MRRKQLIRNPLTKAQIEKCLQISNDISEDIDNHDSKLQLRRAIFYFACKTCQEAEKRAQLETSMKIIQVAAEYMKIGLDGFEARDKN